MVKTKKSSNFRIKNYFNYIIITAVLAITIILNMTGSLGRADRSTLVRIAYSIILAVSLNLVVGFLGELSLGHAGFMCVGAYLGSYCANLLYPLIDNALIVCIISMIIGGLVSAVFGLVIGVPALRLKGDYLAIATLAFGEIVRNIFKNVKAFGGASGLATKAYPEKELFILSFITVLIVLALSQNLIRSKHGRAVTAIRDNEIAAKAMGINVTFYKLFIFVVAAFFAGIAGVLYGQCFGQIRQETFSYNYSIEILVMVVLGGMGSINGSIIAATLITYVNITLQSQLSGEMSAVKLVVYAIILIVAILFNNAPAFTNLKEKLSVKNRKGKKNTAVVKDDDAEWNRITTKIKMNEMLSLDFQNDDSVDADSYSKEDN